MPGLNIPWGKLFPYILTGLVSLGMLIFAYSLGSKHGASAVQKDWDAVEKIRSASILDQQKKNAQKETEHAFEDRKISDELASVKENHDRTVSAIIDDYNKRLLASNQRASVYQRLSQGSAADNERLASHAAELDRSLEEGRRLVGEFRAALEQRDGQLKLLGAQILNDRKLLDVEDPKND